MAVLLLDYYCTTTTSSSTTTVVPKLGISHTVNEWYTDTVKNDPDTVIDCKV